MLVPASPENIYRAAEIIRSGGLVAFPTETVYGLGANAKNEQAVERIFQVKKRPLFNPLIVHIENVSCLDQVALTNDLPCNDEIFTSLLGLWPGPLTLVLPATSRVPKVVTGGKNSVAVRIPAHPVAQALLREATLPIAAPSANISTRLSATTAEHVQSTLGSRIDMVLDGGECAVGVESTILSLLEDPPRILRPGGISVEALSRILHVPTNVLKRPRAETSEEEVLAPGMLKEHYAPDTKLIFRGQFKGQKSNTKVGLISFGEKYGAISENKDDYPYNEVMLLSKTGDLNEVAHNLFSALFEMDKKNLDVIVIDSCEESGIGHAIMDRLRRASAGSK